MSDGVAQALEVRSSLRVESDLGCSVSSPRRPGADEAEDDSWYRFAPASKLVDVDGLRELGAVEGLIAEVRLGTRVGRLILWDMVELSVDFLELGADLGRAAGLVIDREELLSAMEEGAAARLGSRLLAMFTIVFCSSSPALTFRVEAVIRGLAPGTGDSNPI